MQQKITKDSMLLSDSNQAARPRQNGLLTEYQQASLLQAKIQSFLQADIIAEFVDLETHLHPALFLQKAAKHLTEPFTVLQQNYIR